MESIKEILRKKSENKVAVPDDVLSDLKAIFAHNDTCGGGAKYRVQEAIERFAEMGFKTTHYQLNVIARAHFGRKSWKDA